MLNQYRFHVGQFSVRLIEVILTGDDVKSYLQKQSTYNIDQLDSGSFQLVSFLDPQGRVECYGWLVFDNTYRFLFPLSLKEKTISRLNKFLISEDVIIHDPVEKDFTFVIGPNSPSIGPMGTLFDEKAVLVDSPVANTSVLSEGEIRLWQGLTGWPSFDGHDYSFEILNNLRLFDLSYTPNKGCYPGQETVSKIATRRGAAYSPVLIELNSPAPTGEIISFGKKIGRSNACFEWEGKFYLTSSLLRDFRVENMKIQFEIGDSPLTGIVRYYPLISGDNHSKARELFYNAADDFKLERLDEAEKKFRLAIQIDPGFADAYEALGVMLGRLERYQEAIDLMQELSKVDTKSVLAHTNMSLYLMKMGKISEAEEQKSLATIKSFQSFGDEAKKKEVETLKKEKQLKEWAEREEMFRRVLEIDSEDSLANYGLGSIAVERGEWTTAREHLEKVLSSDPNYSVAYLALGKSLKGLGLTEEAIKVWKEGIRISAAKGDLMPANQMQQELTLASSKI